ncbi:hypothetical protein QR98_0042590 [Sarcoptes scabiei]|uniref:Uncharacterized protein n=1 Tax=Sarcoptes scabiei TaxID=52283 RepID=A0A132A488_SARSC|nr:hypothetical protein QR98_0042590 [Sarcoptes scabiei]
MKSSNHSDILCKSRNFSPPKKNFDSVDYQQQLIDNLIRRMMTNLTVSQFMSFGNTADDFLDNGFFRCASDKNHPGKKCM